MDERNTMETGEGVQGRLSQNMSLRHIAYFELKALEKQQVRERPSSPLPPETGDETPRENHSPCTRRKEAV